MTNAGTRNLAPTVAAVAALIGWNLTLVVLAFAHATTPQARDRIMAWILVVFAAMSLVAVLVAARSVLRIGRGVDARVGLEAGLRFQLGFAIFHLLPAAVTIGAVGGIGAVVVMIGGWVLLPRVVRGVAAGFPAPAPRPAAPAR
jgi:hypothetical protein